MSYTYLQELGEESLVESFSEIPAFVLSKLNLTAGESCCNDSEMESYRDSQSGTTCEHSTANRGAERLTLCVEDSRARTYPQQIKKQKDLMVSGQDCGKRWCESLAKYDRASRSWKTHQCLLFEDSTESLETLPRWGIALRGECFPLPTLEHDTYARDFGYWPTPTKASICNYNPAKDTITSSGRIMRPTGNDFAMTLTTWATLNKTESCQTGGKLNPDWQDWLMGWPIKWTDLQPLEMDKFQSWLRSHGKH